MASEGGEPEYADLSQQRVEFMDAPDSTTATITYQQAPQEDYGEREENFLQREHVYVQYGSQPVEMVVNPDVPNGEEDNDASFATNSQSDNDKSRDFGPEGMRRPLRKNRKSSNNANGICPPPPKQPVAMVHWDSISDSRLQDIFPKSYAYQVPVTAKSSVNYFVPARWDKEREFFNDKYQYWCAVRQNPKVPAKERPRLKRLVDQLTWLLHNSWNGEYESDAPPEMLWRARKEEMRRLEQLLVRKQIIPARDDTSEPIPASLTQQSADTVHTEAEPEPEPEVEYKVAVPANKETEEAAIIEKPQVEPSPRLANLKRKSLQQTRAVNISSADETPGCSEVKKTRFQEQLKEKVETPKPKKSHKKKVPEIKAINTTKTTATKRASTSGKSKLYEVPKLGPIEAQKSASMLTMVILFRRWSDVLKKLHCEVGPNARLLCKEVEKFMDEMKVLSRTCPKNLDCLYEKQTALKKKLADNMLDYYYAAWVLCDIAEPVKAEPKSRSAGHRHSSQTVSKAAVADADFVQERKALEAILASKADRYEIEDIAAIEQFARKCIASNVAHIVTAASDVAKLCESYRGLINTPMPRTMADDRHAAKKKVMHGLLSKLLDGTREESTSQPMDSHQAANKLADAQRNKLKIGKKLSITPTSRVAASGQNKSKSLKMTPEVTPNSSHSETPNEAVVSSRPKRHAKPPSRFLFDDEEVDEKVKKSVRSPPKIVPADVKGFSVQNKKSSPALNSRSRNITVPVSSSAVLPTAGTSRMEEFCIVNDEEEIGTIVVGTSERNQSTEGTRLGEHDRKVILPQDKTNTSAGDKIVFDDVELVEPVRKTRRDNAGRIYESFTYKAHFYNGVSQQVSEQAYKEWINRRKKTSSSSVCDTTSAASRSAVKVSNGNSESSMRGSIGNASGQQPSQMETHCSGEGGNDVKSQVQSKERSASSLQNADASASHSDTRNGEHVTAFNDLHSSSVQQSSGSGASSLETSSSSSEVTSSMNAEKAKELISMVKPGGPVASVKLQSQFDHLHMIVETDFIQKMEDTWLPVPTEGPLSESIKSVKTAVARAKHLLKAPTTPWEEYFVAKGNVEQLIAKTVAEFKNVSRVAADQSNDDIIYIPPPAQQEDIKCLPFLKHPQ